MLSAKDNELITRVGPGTPMGNLLRQYWMPSLKSVELPSADCPPVRLRLLGENLIAFRTTSGVAGVIADACPHRGASMFFGRNEEEGLRCVYHGWKFDVEGNCVDMPSEPAESNFKAKVKAVSYPMQERNGIIWTYMGPRTTPPPLPHLEPNMLPEDEPYDIRPYFSDCNWLQSLEGDLDTIHFGFLHAGEVKAEDQEPGSMDYYTLAVKWANFMVKDTEFGATYAAYRPAGPDNTYWRIAQYLFPFYAMVPTGVLGDKIWFKAVVPVDDEHCIRWDVGSTRAPVASSGGANNGRNRLQPKQPLYENTTDWLGRYRPTLNRANDYGIDREAQATMLSYTGIGGPGQDPAVTETMGQIYDRSREHLGVTDSMVIRLRRLLIKMARDFAESGAVPAGVDTPQVYGQRSGGVILPNGVNGIEATLEQQRGFVPRVTRPTEAPVSIPQS